MCSIILSEKLLDHKLSASKFQSKLEILTRTRNPQLELMEIENCRHLGHLSGFEMRALCQAFSLIARSSVLILFHLWTTGFNACKIWHPYGKMLSRKSKWTYLTTQNDGQ